MTDVQICNVALAQLGLNRISSLSSGTREALSCALHYQPTVNELLAQNDWRWALSRATLAVSGGTNHTQREYLYQLPADLIRLVNVYDADGNRTTDYEVEGTKVATDHSAISVQYIPEITVATDLPVMFARAVSMTIAYKIAVEFKQSRALQNDMFNQAAYALSEAWNVDSTSTVTNVPDPGWEKIF